MAENNTRGAGKDPAEAADNPADALVKGGAEFVPDGTGDPNETDHRVEVHASISEGMNSDNGTSGSDGTGGTGTEKDRT